jgi:hypothetical protein
MKKFAFIAAMALFSSCTRHYLNYQSSHPNGSADQDNYPAPQTQNTSGGNSNNYNNNNNYYSDQQTQVDYSSPTYQTFYDELSPYGSWVNYPAYGYAWVPNADAGFSPYSTNGNWIYTSYGWTWNSGYEWGWAPFHYGRWFLDPTYGWMWVPGYQWAPAWVSWGSYNGYYGWAPVEPGAIIGAGYSPPQQYWRFVPAQNITANNLNSYYVSNNTISRNNVILINNSSQYDEHIYFSGPQREEVEASTGSRINTVIVHEANKPSPSGITNNNVNIYRPVIEQGTAQKASPAKITPVENLKPVKTNTEPASSQPKPRPALQPENNSENNAPMHSNAHFQNEPVPQQHPVNNKPQQQGPKPAPKNKPNQPQPAQGPQKKG